VDFASTTICCLAKPQSPPPLDSLQLVAIGTTLHFCDAVSAPRLQRVGRTTEVFDGGALDAACGIRFGDSIFGLAPITKVSPSA
jgi:hypothetical protein